MLFDQSGNYTVNTGRSTVRNVNVNGGNVTLNAGGQTFTATGAMTVLPAASLSLRNGIFAVANDAFVGGVAGGMLTVSAGATLRSDSGLFARTMTVQSGGTVSVAGTADIGVDGSGGAGYFTVESGGVLTTGGATLASGSAGNAVVTVAGNWTNTDDLHVGGGSTAAGGVASLTVGEGGTLTVGGLLKVWNTGGAVDGLRIGGTVNVGDLDTSGNPARLLANWSSGTLNITGGYATVLAGGTFGPALTIDAGKRLGVTGVLDIGADDSAGSSSFTVGSGGVVTTNATVIAATPSGNGIVTVAGEWTNSGNMFVGGIGANPGGLASLTINSGGTLTIGGLLKVWDTGGSVDGLAINGGTVTTGSLDTTGRGARLMSNWSSGTLNLTNSGLDVAASGQLGGAVALPASRTLSVSGTTTVAAGSVIDVSGGTFRTGALVNSGTFTFTGGTVALTNSSLSVDATGPLGGNVSIGTGKTLSVSGATTIAAGSALSISGGTFSTASLVNQNNGGAGLTFSAGAVDLTNSDLLIGSGGLLGSTLNLPLGKDLTISGTTTIAAGAALNLSGGTFRTGNLINNGDFNQTGGVFRGSGTITHNGPGSMVLGGEQEWEPGSRLVIGGGNVSFNSDAGAGGANLAVTVTARGSATFNSSQHLAGLEIGAGASVVIPPSAGANALVTDALEIDAGNGAQLNLGDNPLIVKGGDPGSWNGSGYTGTTGLIASGYNGGAWDGGGIVTSMSDATSGVLTALATATAGEALGLDAGETALWHGETVTADSVLVMYTWGGDADLNGELNGDDYFFIDSNVLNNGIVFGFHNGDFNYDGVINGDDYFAIDSNITFAQASPPFPTGAGGGGRIASVPEPGGIVLAVTGAGMLARRRRRR